ncbi:hypothetical protein A2477_01540 [Candidatus Falkowbacteria bacterium RIFOXYC2_FULL_47_12]|uniref:tRNA (guanine-N(7)-)-methyltransferase n=2 Tax=Candidatus Falkowiibacteriota TaxID=1752728 RepID=A0A1F5TMQ2_9BACT|nr:MAG: hypothetical protein A2242_01175 [Candidatus Falkowbacteria bacterium RIFOXYA2_FULL_47_9]OGF40230.1 MAG: hypothetical protein A2477_01540 [Candidatus Falkowbacteria bacterium RIFOXYC2_FULL_47_12]
MPRKKYQKISELKTFANVLQPAKPKRINWHAIFSNDRPLILELGCGSGVYTRELAKLFLKKNFVGVDTKGARLWQGAKIALADNLTNVHFLRARVENIESYFALLPLAKGEAGRGSVSQIWLTFPDPFPKKRQAKHRLTAPKFLEMYKKILAPGGELHLKTDDLNLLNYSVETLINAGFRVTEIINNLYVFPVLSFPPALPRGRRKRESRKKTNEILYIQTVYEKKHLAQGKQIHYLKAMR